MLIENCNITKYIFEKFIGYVILHMTRVSFKRNHTKLIGQISFYFWRF